MRNNIPIVCPDCNGTSCEKAGRTIKLEQKYKCLVCGITFVYVRKLRPKKEQPKIFKHKK